MASLREEEEKLKEQRRKTVVQVCACVRACVCVW